MQFGHVRRRSRDTLVRKVDEIDQLVKKRDRGRPNKILGQLLKFDMKYMRLNEDMTKRHKYMKVYNSCSRPHIVG